MDKKYFIELRSREDFPFCIHYKIGDDFFKDEEKIDIEGGDLSVDVNVSNLGESYLIEIDIDGIVKVPCDRCLGLIDIDAKNHLELRVRDNDGIESDDEDLILLPQSETGVDLEWTIFEMALLSLPLRRVHKDGECDENMLKILNGYQQVGDEKEETTDPRWDALKALKEKK